MAMSRYSLDLIDRDTADDHAHVILIHKYPNIDADAVSPQIKECVRYWAPKLQSEDLEDRSRVLSEEINCTNNLERILEIPRRE